MKKGEKRIMAKKPKLSKDFEIKCNRIIHGASVAAGGVGEATAQFQLADDAIITPIHIGMITALAKVFDRDITKDMVFSVLKGAEMPFIGRAVSQFLLGWIPVLGKMNNGATASAFTETIGWMSVAQFYDEWLRDGHTPDERPNSFS